MVGNYDCVEGEEYCQIWGRGMDNGDYAMVLYNSGKATNSIKAHFDVFGFDKHAKVLVRDIWKKTDVGVFEENF